jgi:gamma-glutamyl phosphate reductase
MPAKNGLPAEDLAKAVEIARDAKDAFNASQLLNSGERDAALTALNAELISKREEILKFNRMDLEVRLIVRLDG